MPARVSQRRDQSEKEKEIKGKVILCILVWYICSPFHAMYKISLTEGCTGEVSRIDSCLSTMKYNKKYKSFFFFHNKKESNPYDA